MPGLAPGIHVLLLVTVQELLASLPNWRAMPSLETIVGLAAAFCTTVSYFPQLKKCWQTGSAGDLSLKMFLTLTLGIGLWIVYGVMKGDAVIILANGVSFVLLCAILFFKCRETFGGAFFASPARGRE